MRKSASIRQQQGVVMVITLVLLLILFLVTTTGLKSSVTEGQMSGNVQVRMETQQRAHSIVEAVIIDESNLSTASQVGDTNCYNLGGCTESTVAVANDLITGTHGGRTEVEITRLAPLFSPPPRAVSSSAGLFEAANLRVEGTYDGAADRLGKSTIGQGVIVLVRK